MPKNWSEDWCFEGVIGSKITSYRKLNKCQSDILRLLAEKGSHSVYSLAKKLEYRYPYLHKNVTKLGERQLVGFRKDSTGERLKKLVEPNLGGLIVYLLAWNKYEREAKKSVEMAIDEHSELFPFSKQLKKMEEIVGEDLLFKELISTAWNIANGEYVEVKIDHLNLKFKAFIYIFIGRYFSPPKTRFKGKERNRRFADFLAFQEELRHAYISFLAIQDIIDLSEDSLEIGELRKFRSEKELAFFEKRDISTNPLFSGNRLEELFPKYAEMKYVFTGSLLNRLLWMTSEKPTAEEKKRFHVYFP